MPTGEWISLPPAAETEIERLSRSAGVELPTAYLAYLRESNGGDGEIAVEPGYIQLWPAQELLRNNREYEVPLNVPGFFAFGSSGGGEMFAFDLRGGHRAPVVIIPFIPMDTEYAVQIAPDFETFRKLFGNRRDDPPGEFRLDPWGHLL